MDTLIKILMKDLKFFKRKSSKWNRKEQIYFLRTLASLLKQGFSMNVAMNFMAYLFGEKKQDLLEIEKSFNEGVGLIDSIKGLGFSKATLGQISFAIEQGRLTEGLEEVSLSLEKIVLNRRKIQKTLAYPIVLGIFLIALLIGMKLFLLPNLLNFIPDNSLESNFGLRFLIILFDFLPQILLCFITLLCLIYAFLDYKASRLPVIERCQMWCKVPVVSKWVKLFLTHKFAKELGHFLSAGYSLKQVIDSVKYNDVDPFHCQIYAYFDNELKNGTELAEITKKIGIFMTELDLVIFQGQLTSQTGLKCQLYSEKLLDEMLEDIEHKISWIQPILFCLIAVIVLILYLMIMLPMLTMDGLSF